MATPRRLSTLGASTLRTPASRRRHPDVGRSFGFRHTSVPIEATPPVSAGQYSA